MIKCVTVRFAKKMSSAQFLSKRARARFDHTRHDYVTLVKKKPSMDASSTLQHNVAYSVTLASVDTDGWCDKPAQIHAFRR